MMQIVDQQTLHCVKREPCSGTQVQHAVSVLIEHVMFRIGDSNVRLHAARHV